MKKFLTIFLSNGKNLILPIAFSIINLAVLFFVFLPSFSPAFSSVSEDDAFEKGIVLPDYEDAPIKETETVDIAKFGGLPVKGQEIGEVQIENTAIDCPVYFGDSNKELHKGAGIHELTYIPGQGGTIFMGAHTATWFADLGTAKKGDKIFIDTFYGKYEYVVVDFKVAKEDDASAYPIVTDKESLILYTCYPFGTLEITNERYFLYADFVSGPVIEQEVAK